MKTNKYFIIGKKFNKKNQTLDEELDENHCPKYKLALLCGPPGLGKTTLAHLVARQAGKLFYFYIVFFYMKVQFYSKYYFCY